MHLYVATSNPGKLRDFAYAAEAFPQVTLEPLPGLDSIRPPAENSTYFEGNARAKAVTYAAHAPGLAVLADDSGLEVDALDGAPGVRSARFAEDREFQGPPGCSLDERNNLCLLNALDGVAAPRRARYRCVLVLARSQEVSAERLAMLRETRPRIVRSFTQEFLAVAHGVVEGEILTEPRGTGGFGYDPLFYLPELKRTMAELDPLTRLSLSHRGRALKSLLQDFAQSKR